MQFDQRRPHVPRKGSIVLIEQSAYWNNFSGCACGLGQLVIYKKDLTAGTFLEIPQDLTDTNGNLKLPRALQNSKKTSAKLMYLSEYSCKVCTPLSDHAVCALTLPSILAVSSARAEFVALLLL